MSGRIEFTLGLNAGKPAGSAGGDRGYRIYVLGNFSGTRDRPWQQCKISRVDVDNFEKAMADIAPTLTIASTALRFRSLEDFHPDHWLPKLPLLAELRQLRAALSDPAGAEQAAARIRAYLPAQVADAPPQSEPGATESNDDLLLRLLGKKPDAEPAGTTDTVTGLLDRLVAPHVVKDTSAEHRALIDTIDAATSQLLRAALHQPDFQALEALWLATSGLVNEDRAERHQVYLVDIAAAEYSAAVRDQHREFEQRLLEHIRSGDGEQEVILVGDVVLGAGDDSLAASERLAHACGAYFVAGVDPAAVSDALAAQRGMPWHQAAGAELAGRLVLAYPRYLQRLPYGGKRDPLQSFAFEECPNQPGKTDLLWTNSAFICVRALVADSLQPASFDDMPAFSFVADGEQVLQPATETVVSEAEANALLAQGITPVLGGRHRRGIRLMAVATLNGDRLL